MDYNKERPFNDTKELLDNLGERHNLTFSTYDQGQEILLKDGYFTLINGYQRAFETTEIEKFPDGFSLEMLHHLFVLENLLSTEILRVILLLEKKFKNSIQYVISKHINDKNHEYYLNPYISDLYNNTMKTSNNLSRILRKATGHYILKKFIIGDEIPPSKEHPSQALLEYRKTGNIPPWVLVNDLTFGDTLNLYSALQDKYKK